MRLFVSYSRRDGAAVERLRADLVRANHHPWIDADLEGGDQWWDTICTQIRECDAVVVALSKGYLASRACRLELDYASATSRPLVPVQLEDLELELLPAVLATTHIIDYRTRTPEASIGLVVALGAVPSGRPLPAPLPPPPPAPVSGLGALRDLITEPLLDLDQQRAVIDQLRRRVPDADPRGTLLGLAQQFRSRSDLAASLLADTDAVLAAIPVPSGDEQSTRPRVPLAQRDPDSVALLRSVTTHGRSSRLTPIVGLGLTDSLIGSRRRLARSWARQFEFPMARHHQDDLASVAQFVTVTTNAETLRSSLGDYLVEQLRRSDSDTVTDLPTLLTTSWRQRAEHAVDAHTVLARLPCPIYVNASPFSLLADALRDQGRAPEVEICRWRPDTWDWPTSVFEREPGFVPSPERPLVFHVFGELSFPDSIVITEDDYLDFLHAVAEDRALVPPAVRRALADSALMLMGFGLGDWDVRILLRTLVSQEGSSKLHRYTHVAAQVDLAAGVVSPARAQRYLERYFGKFRQPGIDIYWGSVDELAADLDELGAGAR